jgi:hypothetical protein
MAICEDSQFQLSHEVVVLRGFYGSTEDLLAPFATKADAN